MVLRALAFLAATLMAAAAAAQPYPSKPIRLVVGYPPGGSGDFTARIAADELQKELGVSVVVENRPGAGASIASAEVAKAPADGYTLLHNWHPVIAKTLYKDLPYSPDSAFAGAGKVATGACILVAQTNAPFNNVRELIAYAKANPGRLFNASAGFGSTPHLASVAFEAAAGVKFTSVQFKGGGPAAQSLLAGDTHIMFATSPTVVGFIKANRMKPLMVTMRKASPAVPGIPGSDEAGVPGYESTFWFGVFAPTGTPAPILRQINAALAKGMAKPETRTRIASQGMDATPSVSPEAFDREVRAEAPVLEKAMRDSGAKVE